MAGRNRLADPGNMCRSTTFSDDSQGDGLILAASHW
jgi:hypothetical protein